MVEIEVILNERCKQCISFKDAYFFCLLLVLDSDVILNIAHVLILNINYLELIIFPFKQILNRTSAMNSIRVKMIKTWKNLFEPYDLVCELIKLRLTRLLNHLFKRLNALLVQSKHVLHINNDQSPSVLHE